MASIIQDAQTDLTRIIAGVSPQQVPFRGRGERITNPRGENAIAGEGGAAKNGLFNYQDGTLLGENVGCCDGGGVDSRSGVCVGVGGTCQELLRRQQARIEELERRLLGVRFEDDGFKDREQELSPSRSNAPTLTI